ncbi:NADH:ubiquinone reductase (Na(+)-transporting) subunit B [bacterium M21]|nr:NADH:ubiquinone reductase (Na(+)-transporting) subunit B [bacterium M21]
MKFIQKQFDKIRPDFEPGGKLEKLWPLFEAQETFLFSLPHRTKGGAHIRDNMDTKRFMSIVIVALLPCFLFGIYNAGFQHFRALGTVAETPVVDIVMMGLWFVMPIVLTSYIAGGLWEVLFCVVRKHEINEGFLVTGLLLPLTLPPDIPLWKVAVGVSFGVVIGKEVFGGTGMNILNPALVARAFLFFAYAGDMSGDAAWVATSSFPWAESASQVVDGFSGATPLAVAAAHGASPAAAAGDIVNALNGVGGDIYTWKSLFIGLIPGSIGETSALCCLIGAVVLIATGVASWRIMAGVLIGMFGLGWIMNGLGPDPAAIISGELASSIKPEIAFLMQLPPHYHLVMGGFAFGMVFMATDPVSGAQTKSGKWIYGFLIGAVTIIVRVFNTAFMEGMMLSILFANVFASLIDYYVVQAHIKRRARRVSKA